MRLILLFGLILILTSCSAPDENRSSSWNWEFTAAPGEEPWQHTLPTEMGQYWLRCKIDIKEEVPTGQPYGLMVSMLAASEVFWDSVGIGTNGWVANHQDQEIPGKYVKVFALPDSLITTGEHEVLIRFSNFHCKNKFRIYTVSTGDYWSMARNPIWTISIIHIYAGFFLIISLFFLIRFLLQPSRATNLLFALISIAFFALIILEFLRRYYYYPYPWHFTRLQIILGLTILIAFLLPLFFSIHLQLKRYRYFSPIVLLITIALSIKIAPQRGYDIATQWVMLLGFAAAVYITLRGIWLKKTGSTLAIIGLGPILLSAFWWPHYYDYILFTGFGHLTLVMLISVAIQERNERKVKEQAQLLSSRLELELLKKHIQPHFLMNSLTTAIDWIERHPQKGVSLLFALVNEFDIVLDIAEKKLIPIEQEIELCHAHVEIMSFRHEKNYVLETSPFPSGLLVPPAILHTLIENGISHNELEQAKILFRIDFYQQDKQQIFQVFTETNNNTIVNPKREGTGHKYIKTRLEENYPGRWDLWSGPVKNGWQTEIIIK